MTYSERELEFTFAKNGENRKPLKRESYLVLDGECRFARAAVLIYVSLRAYATTFCLPYP